MKRPSMACGSAPSIGLLADWPGRESGSPPRRGAPPRPRRGELERPGFAASPACGAEVVSKNIVGYTKVSLNQKLTILGTSFQDVGSQESTLDISALSAEGLAGGDMARFWNGSTYENVFYYSVNDEGGVYTDDTYETCLGAGWGDINQIAISKTIDISKGFWIDAASAATLTFPSISE